MAPAEKIARHLLGLAYRGLGRSGEAQIELNLGLNAQHYPMPDAWGANAAEHMKLLPDLYEMAKNYSGAGKPEKAAENLEEALAFHPGDLGVMNKLALAYNDSGRPQKGRELLIKVVEKYNRNLPAHLGLASVCASLGEYEQALTYATRATELGPNSAQAYLAEANALLGLERDDDALAALSSASRCDPQNAEIQMTLGDVCLQNLDRPEEALKHFQAAVRLDPTLVSGYVRIGQLKIEEGEFSQARWAVQMIRKLAPTSPALSILEQRLSKLEQLKKNRE